MKRTLFIFLIIFIVMQFFRIDKTNPETNKSLEIKAEEGIMEILKTACYDCHSNETKYPWYSNVAPFSWAIQTHITEGRKALNFSVWENYTQEEKEEHLKDIYRTVYASMPIETYLWVHKEADLSSEDGKIIRDWTGVRSK